MRGACFVPEHTKLLWFRADQPFAALQQCTVLRATNEKEKDDATEPVAKPKKGAKPKVTAASSAVAQRPAKRAHGGDCK